jgi:hypothetical protein
MLWPGEWARHHGPMAMDPCEPRVGRVPPEGVHSPRVRRSLARGGVQHSSEAELRPRGRLALERGGVLSEAEFWYYGAGLLERGGVLPEGCRGRLLLGRRCHPGRSCSGCNWLLVSSFAFLLFCEEMGFSLVIRGPLWLSSTVAPEPLQWYPLGARRG